MHEWMHSENNKALVDIMFVDLGIDAWTARLSDYQNMFPFKFFKTLVKKLA